MEAGCAYRPNIRGGSRQDLRPADCWIVSDDLRQAGTVLHHPDLTYVKPKPGDVGKHACELRVISLTVELATFFV